MAIKSEADLLAAARAISTSTIFEGSAPSPYVDWPLVDQFAEHYGIEQQGKAVDPLQAAEAFIQEQGIEDECKATKAGDRLSPLGSAELSLVAAVFVLAQVEIEGDWETDKDGRTKRRFRIRKGRMSTKAIANLIRFLLQSPR